ncbi:type II toxin-antitoxin system RelE/ParE family toxin [Rubrivivax sp. JA1024]|nr:type II toxin-antitoxin system RelE/ParE family toxin [Rubrivivax sp. JA1024]
MKLVLHPAAEQDLLDAAAFYEREGSPALAARFVAEFKRTGALLASQPEIGTPRSRGRRGLAMTVFPYTLIYRVDGDLLKILVVKHDSRRPGYGGSRS